MNKTFEQLKEGDIVYLTSEEDQQIFECPVLKMQKPATWIARHCNVPEYSVFIEWLGVWVELQFSNWEESKLRDWKAFNHIIIFLDKAKARSFMKTDLEHVISELVRSKQNSQAALEDAVEVEDIVHWRTEIEEINNKIEEIKDSINKL